MLSPDEARIVAAVLTWVGLAGPRNVAHGREFVPTEADADHSALLRRLLDGKAPLPEPPPRSFSYPWYSLIEHGKGDPMEVWLVHIRKDIQDHPEDTSPPNLVAYIDQSRWEVVEKRGDADYVVVWSEGSPRFRLWADDPDSRFGWHLEQIKEEKDGG